MLKVIILSFDLENMLGEIFAGISFILLIILIVIVVYYSRKVSQLKNFYELEYGVMRLL
ncbi:hypothetical protein [Sulfuracidifex tepidarius]|uniref:Uncharacterized protein n=1 Tax=Sulfuracidifex tepidarius TaxID=1294262 RepID=A0A510DT64_9CREN|nr:hypothetical protein [Sulfuracidifex tepidarius]BBG23351.1 hypothetical protein IC006_0635 [Sulfuracidifex tepidarius]BBG26106.1 hypothetical protein IC007_0611 [Sulfuracidifex tepidarius]